MRRMTLRLQMGTTRSLLQEAVVGFAVVVVVVKPLRGIGVNRSPARMSKSLPNEVGALEGVKVHSLGQGPLDR